MPSAFAHLGDLISRDILIDTDAVSRLLREKFDIRISPVTLRVWRHRGRSQLPFYQVFGEVRYRTGDVLDLVASRSEPMNCTRNRATRIAA
jgi:hypothetical protein